jgi:SulP family sulfate permease
LERIKENVELLAILLVAAPLANYIPLTCFAAVLLIVIVAYNMNEGYKIARILQLEFTAIAVWPVTLAL